MDGIKRLFSQRFPLLTDRYRRVARAVRNRTLTMGDVFQRIYQSNAWGAAESVSGCGSSLAQTALVRGELPNLIKGLAVGSLLDIPCGDFNWLRTVDLSGVSYIGADVVPDLVLRNRSSYGAKGLDFRVLDVTADDLPAVDLVLCRDCFIHFSFRHIGAAIRNLARSGSVYLLTTTYRGLAENRDIVTGSYRPVNLEAPPFNFPEPLAVIRECDAGTANENVVEGQRCLGLWKLDKLPEGALRAPVPLNT